MVAVEPSAGMREQLALAVPGARVLAGSAEAVPLPPASADVVLAAQAWHWVDPVRAVPEVARVLRPGALPPRHGRPRAGGGGVRDDAVVGRPGGVIRRRAAAPGWRRAHPGGQHRTAPPCNTPIVPEPLTVMVTSATGARALADHPQLRVVHVDPDDPATHPDRADALVTHTESPEGVERLLAVPGLRAVQLLSAGVEGWAGRTPDGVALVNARGAHGGSTAEWAVAALLAVRRELPRFVRQQVAATWQEVRSPGLAGAHVVVLGAGDLGQNVRRRLEGFEVRTTLVARSARDGVRAMDDLPELLPTADAVVLVLPLTESTRGLVDAALLAALPDGAAVVNAGRGALVDTAALLAELRSGRLLAALDVTDPEPLPSGHELWTAPGVLITPHVGGHTTGSGERAWAVARGQLLALARGEEPSNTIAPDS